MKLSFSILVFALITLGFISCKKNETGTGNSYPKQVTITYKVTSTTTNSLTSITYKNETGGSTDVANPTLPFTKTITKTVNKYDDFTVGYGNNPSQTVKLEISVNNQIVKSQENTAVYAAITYTFQ